MAVTPPGPVAGARAATGTAGLVEVVGVVFTGGRSAEVAGAVVSGGKVVVETVVVVVESVPGFGAGATADSGDAVSMCEGTSGLALRWTADDVPHAVQAVKVTAASPASLRTAPADIETTLSDL
jgi:hypothetical protein